MNIRFRTIVSSRPGVYLRPVSVTRLIRFLTLLALALAPHASMGGAPAAAAVNHAAMAAESHRMTGHAMAGHDMAHDAATAVCDDMDGKSNDQPCGSADCAKACAAYPAIAAVGGQLQPYVLLHGPPLQPALVSVPQGLVPEAAIPPPRALPKI